MKYIVHVLLLFFLCIAPAAAQNEVQLQAQLQQELQERGIPEADFRRRLEEENIDLQNANRETMIRLRPRIAAILNELEAENNPAAETGPPANTDSEPMEGGQTTTIAPSQELEESEQEAARQTATLPPSNIYGHQIFRNRSLQLFKVSENPTPPDDYPLKPGDEIAVSIFGASQSDFILTVDNTGFVTLPVGPGVRVPISGVSIGDARRLLANRLKLYYSFGAGQLSIRIQAVRTISVSIFGEVENVGTFSLSSLNTGFNALIAAGGPTEAGSVRNIQLIQGERSTTLDVYTYLQDPGSMDNQFLDDNATIYVPPAENIITLTGGIQRAMQYELRNGETLSDLINYASGFDGQAEPSAISITRYGSGEVNLINVNYLEQPNFVLQDNDVVDVPVVENPVENFVEIEGAVLLPGKYAFRNGITVAELIQSGRPQPGSREDLAFLFRDNDDGTQRLLRLTLGADAGAGLTEQLQRGDRLRILNQRAFIDRSTITISGAIRDSSVTLPYPHDGSLTLEEAILLSNGLKPNAAPEVLVMRLDSTNRKKRTYLRHDMSGSQNLRLQPYDQIVIYEQERFTDEGVIKITGAVRDDRELSYDPSLSLNDMIYIAGGLRIDADPTRIEVYRLTLDDGQEVKTLVNSTSLDQAASFELRPYDEVVVRRKADFELIQNVQLVGEVRYPGSYALLDGPNRLSDVIERAGGLTSEAFAAGATLNRGGREDGLVVLDLDEVLLNPGDPANVVLLSRDTLYIPKVNNLVTIYTRNTLADRYGIDSLATDGYLRVAYRGPRNAKWYIDNYAGGFNNETARKQWTTVEYASGGLKETNSILGLVNYPDVRPGATIRVGTQLKKRRRERREDRFDWIGLAAVITGAATTIVTFILLNDRGNN